MKERRLHNRLGSDERASRFHCESNRTHHQVGTGIAPFGHDASAELGGGLIKLLFFVGLKARRSDHHRRLVVNAERASQLTERDGVAALYDDFFVSFERGVVKPRAVLGAQVFE